MRQTITASRLVGSLFATTVLWGAMATLISPAGLNEVLLSVGPPGWLVLSFAPYMVFMLIDAFAEWAPSSPARRIAKIALARQHAGRCLHFVQLCLTWTVAGLAIVLTKDRLPHYSGAIVIMALAGWGVLQYARTQLEPLWKEEDPRNNTHE